MALSEIFPGITSDPRIPGGKAVITGTRIPVALLLSHLASGMSVDEIAYEYDLVKDQIYTALAYAARRIEEDRITHQ